MLRTKLSKINSAIAGATWIKKGDILEVNQYENRFVDGIEIYGSIRKPGKYQLSNDAKLSSIISLENDLIESTYLLPCCRKVFKRDLGFPKVSFSLYYKSIW